MATWSGTVSTLSGLCDFPNLDAPRDSCDVIEIDFKGDSELKGSLSPALCDLLKLKYLDLSETNVAGDVKALGNAVELIYLLLSNTKVEGDIEALHNLTKLERLHLENTNVSGNVASLREAAKGLKDVKISSERIAGGRC